MLLKLIGVTLVRKEDDLCMDFPSKTGECQGWMTTDILHFLFWKNFRFTEKLQR